MDIASGMGWGDTAAVEDDQSICGAGSGHKDHCLLVGGGEIKAGCMEVVTSEQGLEGKLGSGLMESIGAEGPWSRGHRG